jgi:hypothetical protein
MKKVFSFLLFITAVCYLPVSAQGQPVSAQRVDKVKFFEEESTVNATLEMDLKDLLAKKAPDRFLPATLTFNKLAQPITENGSYVRGNFRRETCFHARLKLQFQEGQ